MDATEETEIKDGNSLKLKHLNTWNSCPQSFLLKCVQLHAHSVGFRTPTWFKLVQTALHLLGLNMIEY